MSAEQLDLSIFSKFNALRDIVFATDDDDGDDGSDDAAFENTLQSLRGSIVNDLVKAGETKVLGLLAAVILESKRLKRKAKASAQAAGKKKDDAIAEATRHTKANKEILEDALRKLNASAPDANAGASQTSPAARDWETQSKQLLTNLSRANAALDAKIEAQARGQEGQDEHNNVSEVTGALGAMSLENQKEELQAEVKSLEERVAQAMAEIIRGVGDKILRKSFGTIKVRQDRLRSGFHLTPHVFGQLCLDREAQITTVMKYIRDKHEVGFDKMPMVGTMGARGTGKSFMLDVSSSRRTLTKHLKADAVLKRLVVVKFSLGNLDLDHDVNTTPTAQLFCRMANAILFRGTKGLRSLATSTRGLWDDIPENAFFKVLMKLCEMKFHVDDPLLLLVTDEAAAASGAIPSIKSMLDHNRMNCRWVASTFDDAKLWDEPPSFTDTKVTLSGRVIYWLPLASVSLAQLRTLFQSKCTVSQNVLDYYFGLSTGHPRSLAILLYVLTEHEYRNPTEVVEAWQREMRAFVGSVNDDVMLELLAMVLMKHRVRLNARIGGQRIQQLLMSSVIVNAIDPTPETDQWIVPKLSLLRLALWCEHSKTDAEITEEEDSSTSFDSADSSLDNGDGHDCPSSEGNRATADQNGGAMADGNRLIQHTPAADRDAGRTQQAKLIAILVKRMLMLGAALDGRMLEEYHGTFELLRAWAVTVLPTVLAQSAGKPKDPEAPAVGPVKRSLSTWFPEATLVFGKDRTLTLAPPILQPVQTAISFWRELAEVPAFSLGRANQPGADLLQPLPYTTAAEKERVLKLFSELKFSERCATTRLSSADDFIAKIVLLVSEIQHFKEWKNSVFLLVANRLTTNFEQFVERCRTGPSDADHKALWEELKGSNLFAAMVMDRPRLLDHYGPSFSGLGGFMLDHSIREGFLLGLHEGNCPSGHSMAKTPCTNNVCSICRQNIDGEHWACEEVCDFFTCATCMPSFENTDTGTAAR